MTRMRLLHTKINTVTDAKTAYRKFFLRELLTFFIEKRSQVLADDDFSFSTGEFKNYLKVINKTAYFINEVTDENIKDVLAVCKKSSVRDHLLHIPVPPLPLLDYTPKRNHIFEIKNCFTEYLVNFLRFLDTSLNLGDWKDGASRNCSKFNKSCFDQTQDHKLIFLNKTTETSLSKKKESPVFNHLKRNFKVFCPWEEIYETIIGEAGMMRGSIESEDKGKAGKPGYVSDAVDKLREKLCHLSGYPEVIETSKKGGETSFRLTY